MMWYWTHGPIQMKPNFRNEINYNMVKCAHARAYIVRMQFKSMSLTNRYDSYWDERGTNVREREQNT